MRCAKPDRSGISRLASSASWVLIAEFVIDRYGLDEYLPFYR